MDNPEKLATIGTQDTRRRQTNQKHKTTCVGHHYAEANWNDVNDDETYAEDIYRVLRTITTAVYLQLLDFATVSVISLISLLAWMPRVW
jgi:hypothetical protein